MRKSPPTVPLDQRVMAKVERSEDGCWLWTAHVDRLGYARLQVSNRYRTAHRIAYELWVGEIPEELELDHLCRNRRCVNPDHLEAVTHAENIRRAHKTHCKRGHALGGPDADVYIKKNGTRQCRPCLKLSQQKYAARKKAESVSKMGEDWLDRRYPVIWEGGFVADLGRSLSESANPKEPHAG